MGLRFDLSSFPLLLVENNCGSLEGHVDERHIIPHHHHERAGLSARDSLYSSYMQAISLKQHRLHFVIEFIIG
ncbi:hypothetical protein FGO68_gene9224 [Halteria grandinella]|uniref:Uncharacterized protein n=1 Tax=Halteria grandinella TaxID=5974 RepID=A0A8J8NCN6_HALGN|nr:hypothetical protein FGO68_gene9224 [Halteria grandinella]